MCGIVGLLIRDPALYSSLGNLVVPMLDCMGDRGPDSAGLAVFAEQPVSAGRKFSLFSDDPTIGWQAFFNRFSAEVDSLAAISARARHAIVHSEADRSLIVEWLTVHYPKLHVLSVGRWIDVYKDEGHPREVAARYGFETLRGTHAVGHTRMATESAVSPAHAHPFTAGEDFCLVHNGSFSNPWSIRRKLERQGIAFETDNDTEAACRYLQWRMQLGDNLEDALRRGFDEWDGFYTLLMATAEQLVLVRDAFACKPAIVAQTDAYVAIGSEYRALAHLPGIERAELFEPVPERIYAWPLPERIAACSST